MSHALLHDREVMDAEGVLKDQTTKEVEGSIAHLVCSHFGLDASLECSLHISPAGARQGM